MLEIGRVIVRLRTWWGRCMEVASTFISEKKSKEISTEMMNRAHELRDMLERNQVSFDAEFKDRIAKLADFQDVSANLDSMKDTQAAMNSIMTEIKELVDEKFGSELLESCETFLAKQWTSTSVAVRLQDLCVVVTTQDQDILLKMQIRGQIRC